MANMQVTYEEMRTAAMRLRNGQSEIEGKLAELKTMIEGLVSQGYVTDQSSKAFDASYTDFNDGVRKTVEGLDGMGTFLERAAETLEQADASLANAIR